MKKRHIFIAVFLIIVMLIPAAEAANFTIQKSFDWLAAEGKGGNYGSVFSAALAALAFERVGYESSASDALDWILQKKDPKGCFPSGSCTVKDTALALKAISEIRPSEDTESVISWLKSARSAYIGSGKWGLFITTESSGTCELSYTIGDELKKISVEVKEGKFPSCQNSELLDIDKCVKANLLSNNPGISITVDCSQLSGTPFITLVYQKNNEWFVQNTWEQNVVDVKINNVCYGKLPKQDCTKSDSGYVDWALTGAGESAESVFFMKTTYTPSEVLDNFFLFTATQNNAYIENLKKYQKSDGSFDESVEKTSFAIMALKSAGESVAVDKATEWLISKAADDGSWGSFSKTALALFAAFSDSYIGESASSEYEAECSGDDDCFSGQECIDGFCVDKEKPTDIECEYDIECDPGFVCSADNKCVPEQEGGCKSDSDCAFGEECVSGECQIKETKPVAEEGCGSDSDCSIGEICQDGSCVPEPKKKSSGWIVIIIILLLIGGAGFFIYNKFLKKGPGGKKGSGAGKEYRPFSSRLVQKQKPGQVLRRPIIPGGLRRPLKPLKPLGPKTKTENQLSKSLEEAKKLLKK